MMRIAFVVLTLLLVGCGRGEFQIVPVSGTVTLDGKPLEGVEIVFAPIEDQNKVDVGPASFGVTDSDGRYALKTVKGALGAVATTHKVSISYPEVSEATIAAKIDEAVNKNRSMPEAEVMALERRIRNSFKNPKSIPDSYSNKSSLSIEINGATEQANFELKSDGT